MIKINFESGTKFEDVKKAMEKLDKEGKVFYNRYSIEFTDEVLETE